MLSSPPSAHPPSALLLPHVPGYHSPLSMARRLTDPALRRFLLYTLVLLAFAMVSGVIFILLTDESVLTVAEAFPEPVILDPEKRPHFVFPDAARTYDLSLNEFVDRFARVCMQGKYSDFRLMLSTRRPPILPARFESNFNALKEVRILGLEKVPDMPEQDGPVYVMKAAYDLQDFAAKKGEKTREVHVAIAKEDGRWRIGPIPHEALARLAAYQRSTSQPTTAKAIEEVQPPPEAQPATQRAAANRPLTLEP